MDTRGLWCSTYSVTMMVRMNGVGLEIKINNYFAIQDHVLLKKMLYEKSCLIKTSALLYFHTCSLFLIGPIASLSKELILYPLFLQCYFAFFSCSHIQSLYNLIKSFEYGVYQCCISCVLTKV